MHQRFPRLHSLLHGQITAASTSGAVHLCRQSAVGVKPMTFPAFRAMGQPFNGAKRFDFETVAFSADDECLLVLEMHSTTL